MNPYIYLLNGAPVTNPSSGSWVVSSLTVSGNETVGGNLTVSGSTYIGTASGLTKLYVYDSGNTFAASFRGTGAANTLVAIGTTTDGAAINAYTSTFSATANLLLQPNGGNLLLAKTVDDTLGKLQVGGSITATEGTNVGLFGFFSGSSLVAGTLGAQSFILRTNNTAALTLDSSQNATFAGTIKPQQAATASAPTYVKGAIYFDTTLNKLRVGGGIGWETITSV